MKKQYILKSAVVEKIERLISIGQVVLQESQESNDYEGKITWLEHITTCKNILDFLDTLETKELEEDEELTGLEKEVAYGTVEQINRKRIPINLKGDLKAKFKNEFNTMWQVIGGIQFAKVAKHIIERLCLEFATWGAYNLKGIGEIGPEEKEKMDTRNT